MGYRQDLSADVVENEMHQTFLSERMNIFDGLEIYGKMLSFPLYPEGANDVMSGLSCFPVGDCHFGRDIGIALQTELWASLSPIRLI
jgi:hypothetical protein